MKAKLCAALVALALLLAAGAASAAVATNPESVNVTSHDSSYTLTVAAIGHDEKGNTTVGISGMGNTLLVTADGLMMPVAASISAGGQEFSWDGASLDVGVATFTFQTALAPDSVILYPYDDPDARAVLTIGSSAQPETPAPTEQPAEPTPTPQILASDGAQIQASDISVIAVEDPPLYLPYDMFSDERAVAAVLTIGRAQVWDALEAENLFFDAILADAQGQTYFARTSVGSLAADGTYTLKLLFVIQGDSALDQLTLSCAGGQWRLSELS